MNTKVLTFNEQVVQNVVKQIQKSDIDPTFHDVYIKMQQTEGTPDLTTPEGRVKAFVINVPANDELGTPGGRHIWGTVKTPVEQFTNVATKITKTASRQSKPVIFNIFDNGQTSGVFSEIHGAIERNEFKLIGDGVYELTKHGVKGKCLNPTYPAFYIRDKQNNIMMGKTRLANGTLSAEKSKRSARTRPMFLLEPELAGVEARIDREVHRMDFVNTDQVITADENETTEIEKTISAAEQGKGQTAEIKTETAPVQATAQ